MRRKLLVIAALLSLPALSGGAHARQRGEGAGTRPAESSLVVSPDVDVTLCVASGHVAVRGWGRDEVRAVSSSAARVELRPEVGSDSAARLKVLVHETGEAAAGRGEECRVFGNVELRVPRGATVRLKTRSGNVTVEESGAAYVETVSGDVDLRRIAGAVEAASISGHIFVEGCGGAVRLRSSSGNVKATDARAGKATDELTAKSMSGEVALERVDYSRVEATSVSGNLRLSAPLAAAGRYELKSTLGDVTLTLPGDLSFSVEATVSRRGEIVSDFPLEGGASRPAFRRLGGTYGGGGMTLKVSSFSGTVRLLRRE